MIAVRDLDRAAERFAEHGFRLKQGRLHPNNLLNRHMKFRDGSELELMAVRGEPGDAMAEDYARLAADREGGVYVALTLDSFEQVERAAARLGFAPHRSASGGWPFVSFPDEVGVAAVFFANGAPAPQDADSIFEHRNGVTGLEEAWIEAGPGLRELLAQAGAVACGTVEVQDGRTGERWRLARGSLVLLPAPAGARPRVAGVVLSTTVVGDALVVQPIPGFWIRFRPDGAGVGGPGPETAIGVRHVTSIVPAFAAVARF